MSKRDSDLLFCARCGATLTPGRGNFYIAQIEAYADPTPMDIDDNLDEQDLNAEFTRLMEEMRTMSQQELMDQVYRRLTLHLCASCYRVWIEKPAG